MISGSRSPVASIAAWTVNVWPARPATNSVGAKLLY
jgi:hypothetical protein